MKRSIVVALLVCACTPTPRPTPQPSPHEDEPIAAATPPAEPTAAAEPAPAAAPAPPTPPALPEVPTVKEPSFFSMDADALDGKHVDFKTYKGKVALVVNVASECGFTPQYEGLEKLWRDYKDKGVLVLGFPSNEFGDQEPGDAAEIQAFCTKNYGVTFPLFAKVVTKKGAKQSPVYSFLTGTTGKQPNWNFCKYLIGKDGNVIQFWQSKTTPESAELRGAIDAALAVK